MKKLAFCLFGLGLIGSTGAMATDSWQPAYNPVSSPPSPGQSCLSVCQTANASPVVGGIFTPNNNPFYVCRALNFQSAGHRPGFNLVFGSNYASACDVGSGGAENLATSYQCLCTN